VLVGDRLFVTAEPTQLLGLRASDGLVLWQHEVTVSDTLVGPDRMAQEDAARKAKIASVRLLEIGPELSLVRRQARRALAPPPTMARLAALETEERTLRATLDQGRPEVVASGVGMASSTPVSDGRSVFALFGNYIVAAFTLDGELRWARAIPRRPDGVTSQRGSNGSGQAASLLLVDGRLIVPLTRLNAFDAETGEQLWEGEAYNDFGTPALAQVEGATLLITPDGHAVDAKDGRTVARDLGDTWWVSPVAHDHDLFFLSGHAGAFGVTTSAVRLPAYAGAPFSAATRWTRSQGRTDRYASPLMLPSGQLVLVDNRQHLTVLDTDSGAVLHERTLQEGPVAEVWASPTLAGDHLFILDEAGHASVLEATFPFRTVARNELERIHASPVFAGRRLYLRGMENLYCLGEPEGAVVAVK
jgi:outer membrane protein assembly factor BamB